MTFINNFIIYHILILIFLLVLTRIQETSDQYVCWDVLLLNLLTPSEVCLFNECFVLIYIIKASIHPHPFAFNFIIFNIRFMDLVLIGFEKDFHINIIINLYIMDSKFVK